jgi:hypothetical protein
MARSSRPGFLLTLAALERLGHSRVGITLDLYSHVTEGLQDDAVTLVDDAMAMRLLSAYAHDERRPAAPPGDPRKHSRGTAGRSHRS